MERWLVCEQYREGGHSLPCQRGEGRTGAENVARVAGDLSALFDGGQISYPRHTGHCLNSFFLNWIEHFNIGF